ncbi:hypothetical protein Tco_0208569, partial [Tanacetum coccineum]
MGHQLRGRVLFKFNVWVSIGKCNRFLERQKKPRNQIFRALTASADVPSSVTETTDTTSTLPPPPPPVLHEMTSDQIRSDLTPNRQETFVDNISSDLISNKQKASDYDNSDPVPPRQNVVPIAEKTDSSHQGLEFLFSPLLEEYYNPTHGLAEENNND